MDNHDVEELKEKIEEILDEWATGIMSQTQITIDWNSVTGCEISIAMR